MPVLRPADAEDFTVHGSRFSSFVRSATGAQSLCAWRLEVPAGLAGVPHRPSHEEILLVLDGSLRVTLEGRAYEASAGDVIHVPAGSELSVNGGPDGGRAWVTTTPGLAAQMGDGEPLRPPWAQ